MLHEILLSLAGTPSTIWDQAKSGDGNSPGIALNAYVSPAERAMLETLGELAELHLRIREASALVTRSHTSTICRAVSSRISSKHLQDFVQKIIEVEQAILHKDAKFVGAYKIVPLSAIVAEFQPWVRPLRWLDSVVTRLQRKLTTGAVAMRICKDEMQTGYTDIRSISEDLLITAERAWISSLLPWLVFGRLPVPVAQDFMIQHDARDEQAEYTLLTDRVPFFVSERAACAVLEAGSSISGLQHWISHGRSEISSGSAASALLSVNHQEITNLEMPLQSDAFEKTVTAINRHVSDTVLSTVLPSHTVLELLEVIQNFVLLKSGEFAACLTQEADEHLKAKGQQQYRNTTQPVKKLGRLDGLGIGDADNAAILEKSFSALAALMPKHEAEVLLVDEAATYLKLITDSRHVPRVNTLLPNHAALTIDLRSDSPLRMFLNPTDINSYRSLSAYLVSLRRAEARFNSLWQITTHRRYHSGLTGLRRGERTRERSTLHDRQVSYQKRHRWMRAHWATASQAVYVLTTLRAYCQGEVISNSWSQLRKWLRGEGVDESTSTQHASQPAAASSQGRQPDSFISSVSANASRRDPRAMARAHRIYLANLKTALLIEQTTYVTTLNNLLKQTDHYTALFHRIAVVWTALDLQEADGSIDAFSDFSKEETEILAELDLTNKTLKDLLKQLVESVKAAEHQFSQDSLTPGVAGVGLNRDEDEFVPWRARTIDRLIMKLDFLTGGGTEKMDNLLDGSDEEWYDA